jgi:CDGSH-type Zn-finger protein/truncated hemoglobin YjbI/ferredoxin
MEPDKDPRIEVLPDGPYRVTGPVTIRNTDGTLLRSGGTWHLCRCGGSRNKPFCDATHGLKGFVGTETADHALIAERRDEYVSETVTVQDDRGRCAHFGQCSDRLPAVFRAHDEPFVDPTAAPDAAIAEVVRGCPSGALAVAPAGSSVPDEDRRPPSVTPITDGPYRVRGVVVVGADGREYEARERQTLCRCGHSRNKPFCDGSHWYAEFRDPVPEAERVNVPTPYEFLGGIEVLERLTTAFYDGILGEPDPVLEPVFRGMHPDHPSHVAAWLAETFGGPARYTAEHGGYEHMVDAHRDRGLTEDQRQQWVRRLIATADEIGLTRDLDFRSTFVAYLEWGSRLAVINSTPGAELIDHAPVPQWRWGQTPPYVPSPWDDPQAAARGRERHARTQTDAAGRRSRPRASE